MLQEDYVIRMVRLAVAALATIFGLKQSGSYQQALDLIAVHLTQLTGMDDRLLVSLDDASLMAVLSNRQGPDYDRMIIVADLLQEANDVYTGLGLDPEGRTCALRALSLYLEAALGPVEYPTTELGQRIDRTLESLGEAPLPAESLYPLWFYLEKTGQYGRAILTLSELFRQAGVDPELKDQGLAFFQRLARLDDAELEAGGTNRLTVMEKLLQLKDKGKLE
jgi:hypothetical protein